MTPAELLTDAFARISEGTESVLDDLTAEQLAWRPGPAANPIGWLVWHLLRVQDDHVAEVGGTRAGVDGAGLRRRFGLPYDDAAIGYGHTSDEVAALRVERRAA